jgi:hypothetical protein
MLRTRWRTLARQIDETLDPNTGHLPQAMPVIAQLYGDRMRKHENRAHWKSRRQGTRMSRRERNSKKGISQTDGFDHPPRPLEGLPRAPQVAGLSFWIVIDSLPGSRRRSGPDNATAAIANVAPLLRRQRRLRDEHPDQGDSEDHDFQHSHSPVQELTGSPRPCLAPLRAQCGDGNHKNAARRQARKRGAIGRRNSVRRDAVSPASAAVRPLHKACDWRIRLHVERGEFLSARRRV